MLPLTTETVKPNNSLKNEKQHSTSCYLGIVIIRLLVKVMTLWRGCYKCPYLNATAFPKKISKMSYLLLFVILI